MNLSSCMKTAPAARSISGDAVFTSEFYKPYEAAVETAFLMLCSARTSFCEQDPTTDVRAMTFRLKSPASIRGKLEKRGLPVCEAAAATALNDIAGLRVVLSSPENVYRFAALVRQSPVAQYAGMRDYIANPKESGYRSLHLIMRIPVTVDGQSWLVPVEIQLRTAAMDLWATIDHDLVYKPVKAALSLSAG